MNLAGSFTTNKRSEFRVRLNMCRNNTSFNTTCASQDEQDKFFKTYDFQARFVNKYFDFNDFEKPIKAFIDDRMFFPIQPFMMKVN